MAEVTELRVTLTVENFEQALAFYRDALGLEQLADWSTDDGKVVVLAAGRATLELFDQAQAASVDEIEAGRRVSGTVRLALKVPDSEQAARELVAAGADEVAPPVTTPWGDRNARVQAPDGMQLRLVYRRTEGSRGGKQSRLGMTAGRRASDEGARDVATRRTSTVRARPVAAPEFLGSMGRLLPRQRSRARRSGLARGLRHRRRDQAQPGQGGGQGHRGRRPALRADHPRPGQLRRSSSAIPSAA